MRELKNEFEIVSEVYLGFYSVDFILKRKKIEKESTSDQSDSQEQSPAKAKSEYLIVEIDGLTHFYQKSDQETMNSRQKIQLLEKAGLKVLRIFPNCDRYKIK